MGDLSASDWETLVKGIKDVYDLTVDVPLMAPLPTGLTLNGIAAELGRNPSSVRKRAKKLGIWMEKVWYTSPQGTRQETWVTNPDGRAALAAWYGGDNG